MIKIRTTISVTLILTLISLYPLKINAEPVVVTQAQVNDYQCVLITGYVTQFIPDNPVILKIMSKGGNLVEVRQLSVDADKKFATIAHSNFWHPYYGEFFVESHYGAITNKTEFFVGHTIHEHGIFSPRVDFDGYGIYMRDLFPGRILNTTINPDEKSITFLVDTESLYYSPEINCKSTFIAEIPRELFDAKDETNKDIEFLVLADGQKINYTEQYPTNDHTRYIEATINGNTHEIKIMGTNMIPEFGTVASLILIVSLISMIGVFRVKFRKNPYNP